MTKTTILFLDTETTSLKDPHVCELCLIKCVYIDVARQCTHIVSGRIKPPVPILAEATKIHGITNEAVSKNKLATELYSSVANFISDVDILCSHNIRFDLKVLRNDFRPVFYLDNTTDSGNVLENLRVSSTLDTLRLSRILWPGESNKLEDVRTRLNLPAPEGEAHGARYDTLVCRSIFEFILAQQGSIQSITGLQSKPVIVLYWPLGKLKGERIDPVKHKKTINWYLDQTWFAEQWPDLAYTFKQYR